MESLLLCCLLEAVERPLLKGRAFLFGRLPKQWISLPARGWFVLRLELLSMLS